MAITPTRTVRRGFAVGRMLAGLTLLAATAPAAAQSTLTFVGARAIPDNNSTGVLTLLGTLERQGLVTDVDLRLDALAGCSAAAGDVRASLAHTYVGDLRITLVSPSGTEVIVFDRRGGSTNNLCQLQFDDDGALPPIGGIPVNQPNPVSGTFTPEQPLSAFDGENPNGEWLLRIADLSADDTGTLHRATVVIATAPLATIAVDVLDDPFPGGCAPGSCSLREAMILANQRIGRDRIVLGAGDHVLTRAGLGEDASITGDLDAIEEFELVGAGRAASRIVQQGDDRIVDFIPGVRNVLFTGISLVGGGGGISGNRVIDHGGAVRGSARFLLDGVAFENNHARLLGGAYYAPGGSAATGQPFIDWHDCHFTGNTASSNLAGVQAGGAVYNQSAGFSSRAIVIEDCTFTDNVADDYGGAISLTGVQSVSGNVARIARTAFTGNIATNEAGGAIAAQVDTTGNGLVSLVVHESTFDDNAAAKGGGAIASTTQATIGASQFHGNAGKTGGAIWSPGFLTIVDATLCDNTAVDGGGAVHATLQTTVLRSTFCRNVVTTTDTAAAGGGAMLVGTGTGTTRIERSTFVDNVALRGGALSLGVGDVQLVHNTITRPVTLPAGALGSAYRRADPAGTLLEATFNLIVGTCNHATSATPLIAYGNIESTSDTCRFNIANINFGNQTSVPAAAIVLGALGDNGGPTPTRLPGAGSVAIDMGEPGNACEDRDQRGHAANDAACDVGAVEAGAPAPASVVFQNGFE